jgi:preprotein translocase subunit SecD
VAPPGTLRVGRYFLALVVLFGVLYALVFLPAQRHTPKLGIDLVGGIRVIFTAVGNTTPTQMDQARQIMEDRVNGTGVTQSTVVVQGGNQIVISIPNGTGADVAALGQPAKLNFRGVVAPPVPVTCGPYAPGAAKRSTGNSGGGQSAQPSTGNSGAGQSAQPSGAPSTPSSTAAAEAPNAAAHHLLADKPTRHRTASAGSSHAPKSGAAGSGTATGTPSPSASPSASPTPSSPAPSAPPVGAPCTVHSVADLQSGANAVKLPDPGSVYASNGLDPTAAQGLASKLTSFKCSDAQTEPDLNAKYYLVCGDHIGINPKQKYAFLLGPVVVPGTQISSAAPQAPNASQGQADWTVLLHLKDSGDAAWSKYTGAHNIGGTANSGGAITSCGTQTPCADFVAFTLNGAVISAPVNEEQISGLPTQISGNFTPTSARQLAQQLQYGALPLTFKLDENQHVSATLGTAQLKAAFLAGGIGLILVVLYSLGYYRGLGLVTIASLLVSAGFTYAMLVILGEHLGFTLDLSGIAGFIVALGITADSFVVFFERIKDEVHDGRSFRVAVPRAWVRARRTILSADTVSFLAAAILYYFASAEVKGFAFTLGLSTILDLVVVFLFTHPMLSILSRSRAFGSPRFTGLNALRPSTGTLPDDDQPRGRGLGSRVRRSAPGTADRAGSATVAVAEPDTATGPAPDAAAEPPADPQDDKPPAGAAETEPRRHTTPAPGTAAERAAARRARMRQQRDEGGTR